MKLWLQRMRSPIGRLLLVADDTALRALDFEDYEDRLHRLLARFCKDYELRESRAPNDFSKPVKSYFDGNLAALDEIPVRTNGTDFQRLVWTALRDIPAGTTTIYGRLAERIGRPTAVRAVGAANGANPISIVVPCHRAVGADGHLIAYGGGLERKEWLLRHERGG
jgi:methylated-DNA-[protein]-cysteine S-methyltransferase